MVSYTNQQLLEELYQRWFAEADANHDGKVSGQEAVAFFMPKAGLDQETLGAIWSAGSRGAADLDPGSFRTICQLIWYAQSNGNHLPPNSQGIVSKILSGIVTMPPPKLAGLPVHSSLQQMAPVGIVLPGAPVGFGASPTGAMPPRPSGAYTGGPTGGAPRDFRPPQPWMTSSGQFGPSFSSAPTGQFGSGLTGQIPIVPAPKPEQFGAAPTGQPDFPAITPPLARKYALAWQAAQKDEEGNVPGRAVLALVASVPVDKEVKKGAWNLIAGAKSVLTTHQLFTMLYLLDLYPIRGSLPAAIPSGVFPPSVHMCFQAAGLPLPLALQPEYVPTIPVAQQNPVENLNLTNPVSTTAGWTMSAHAPKAADPYAAMPPLPPRATFAQPKDAAAYSTEGRLPQMDMGALGRLGGSAEGRRLQQELAAAGEKDRAVWDAEQSLAAANRQNDFYTAALQELTLFKGRSERALLDVQSRAEAAKREADQQKSRYEQVYEQAMRATSQNQELQDAITTAVRSKAEWESKLAVLQQELQSLAAATPETVKQLQSEVVALEESVRAAEMDKAHFDMQTEGLRESKAALETRLATLRDQVEASKANCKAAEEQVEELTKELVDAKVSEEAIDMGSSLSKLAALYRELHEHVRASAVPVPDDAVIASSKDVVWHEDMLLGARNWTEFDNAGWTLIENLPGLPDSFCAAYFITTAQPKSTKPAAPQPVSMENPYGPKGDAYSGMVRKGGVGPGGEQAQAAAPPAAQGNGAETAASASATGGTASGGSNVAPAPVASSGAQAAAAVDAPPQAAPDAFALAAAAQLPAAASDVDLPAPQSGNTSDGWAAF